MVTFQKKVYLLSKCITHNLFLSFFFLNWEGRICKILCNLCACMYVTFSVSSFWPIAELADKGLSRQSKNKNLSRQPTARTPVIVWRTTNSLTHQICRPIRIEHRLNFSFFLCRIYPLSANIPSTLFLSISNLFLCLQNRTPFACPEF